jgi:hypothetical protein
LDEVEELQVRASVRFREAAPPPVDQDDEMRNAETTTATDSSTDFDPPEV